MHQPATCYVPQMRARASSPRTCLSYYPPNETAVTSEWRGRTAAAGRTIWLGKWPGSNTETRAAGMSDSALFDVSVGSFTIKVHFQQAHTHTHTHAQRLRTHYIRPSIFPLSNRISKLRNVWCNVIKRLASPSLIWNCFVFQQNPLIRGKQKGRFTRQS